VQIASIGPMVIVPDDDKLDHELESRRIRLDKAKAGSAHPSGLDQEVGETLDDDDTREGLERFLKFLKRKKKRIKVRRSAIFQSERKWRIPRNSGRWRVIWRKAAPQEVLQAAEKIRIRHLARQ
jgi:hypothetical protein